MEVLSSCSWFFHGLFDSIFVKNEILNWTKMTTVSHRYVTPKARIITNMALDFFRALEFFRLNSGTERPQNYENRNRVASTSLKINMLNLKITSSFINGAVYNPYKFSYKWVTEFMTPKNHKEKSSSKPPILGSKC